MPPGRSSLTNTCLTAPSILRPSSEPLLLPLPCICPLLMLTTCLSYLPYTQIWIYQEKKFAWMGCLTNRGKLNIEIEFENLIRYIENNLLKNKFSKIN